MHRLFVIPAVGLLIAAGCSSDSQTASTSSTTDATTTSLATSRPAGDGTTTSLPAGTAAKPVGHVAVIVLENEGYEQVFGSGTSIPYLAKDLAGQGRLLTQYFGTSHVSLGNYISMISGQPANPQTATDCVKYTEFTESGPVGPNGEVSGSGCVYPSSVRTIGDQLTASGKTWKNYAEDMAKDPAGRTTCRHPTIGSVDNTLAARPDDKYATRHVPFVYFHSIIDTSSCAANVVDLTQLDADLTAASTTPNLTFITPNLCSDGHDDSCVDGSPGGMPAANSFLQTWVPKILASPGFIEDGLVIVTFDEAEAHGDHADSSGCCGQTKGGGRIGAVLVGPSIAPGVVDERPNNHYGLLCTLETIFGLDKLALANTPGLPCAL